MPDARLDDGSRLFDHLRGRYATELVTPGGPRILIRPDGYIAHIGSTHFAEYAGEPTRQIRGTVPQLSLTKLEAGRCQQRRSPSVEEG